MKLKDLLSGIEIIKSSVDMDVEITSVTYDSRKAIAGSLFVAVTGFVTDGNLYIPKALENGAVAVVTAVQPKEDIPYILVKSDRLALALIGANFYGHPAKAMKIIGVTGTNGKTTSTLLLKHILESARGAKVGLLGTMDNMIGQESVPAERTTPESLDLHALFAKMRDAKCQYAIMEVSSHAIALERVGGVHFDVAAFTNLTEDHLDFHETMENYCDAKAELFARCTSCVINADDDWAKRICAKATGKMLTTSIRGHGDLQAQDMELLSDGICFVAVYQGKRVQVKLPIPGKFTVYNAMTALGCALQLGVSLEEAAKALAG